MPRDKLNSKCPIKEYLIYHGWDQDIKKWFIEIQIPKSGKGQILEWFDSESLYKNKLKDYI